MDNASSRIYIAIDLKSFYASVECAERDLDPLTTNLVVADKRRTAKTICLAVSAALKSHGLPGRGRLFEIMAAVKEVNRQRRANIAGGAFTGSSFSNIELEADPYLALDYIVATPRMALYLQKSTQIYEVYLRHVAPQDIHVYSIDEVFIDVTGYLRTTGKTAQEFAEMLIGDVFNETGITATVGIGTNLYLAKVAMDIVAKHMPPNVHGARIAQLDELSYRHELWSHRPLRDFWRVGKATARKLEQIGLNTMGDIARCSLAPHNARKNEDTLYELFGINAELLIDHAWGWEPCTIEDVKAYRPESSSLGTGQVLHHAYDYKKMRLVIREMAEQLSLDLVDKGLATDQIVITIGYDRANIADPKIAAKYDGEIRIDRYGRKIPRHSHGTQHLTRRTSSSQAITRAALVLFDTIVDKRLLVRRVNITACNVMHHHETAVEMLHRPQQLDLLTDYEALEIRAQAEDELLAEERRRQKAILAVRKRFGKNMVLKGTNLQKDALQIQRNKQIGGHSA